jgi:hypothetical protein
MLLTALLGLALFAALSFGLNLSTSPYIPPKDADAVNWATNFAATITANPGLYGLTAGDASAITTASSAFSAAYAIGGGSYHSPVNPATKTPTTTQDKVNARVSMEAILRPYAIQISRNAGVSSGDKIAVGVNPRTSVPTPILAPTSIPALSLTGGTPLQHTLRYTDSAAVTGKAKPFGALQLQVFAMTSATPITDPTLIAFYGVATKSPFVINYSSGDANKVAYVVGRWVTRTGLVGAFGSIIQATGMA